MSNKDKHTHAPGHPTVGHVSSPQQLLTVFGALVFLTIVTVALSGKLPGTTGMMIAMGIATVKALLVALYFMHLRYDRPFNGYLFLASILFVAVFFGITSLDTAAYRKDIAPFEEAYMPVVPNTHIPDPESAYPRATKASSLHTDSAADGTESEDASHSEDSSAEAAH